ncbi:hypothetical protein BT63DRAFT_457722 [Microthyrium microscopicum]|uniref:Methyltransferase domain-containing protein n=1 Tax=Microthyrium microscopicum TaxID=703497 RepID=A0A6A6U548_9PEZI|nr:hypothetical protein BT63DRAFT_457722 [Microthyrium microscopicum]
MAINKSYLTSSSWYNPLLFRRPLRLFEICDLELCPNIIRAMCQSILTAEWTACLPIIQKTSPAEMAASIILEAIGKLDTRDARISIVDFCSGAGGPVPTIERIVNQKRMERGQQPINFMLTDIKPHIEAWTDAASKSENLTFISQPVDATNPPQVVISNSETGASTPTRIFRLYCLAFHHFDDRLARKVVASTLATADGFAIIELQDRRLSSILLMFLHFFLVLVTGVLWFWRSPVQLLFTYVIPVMPFILAFDGAVSSLRTREFGEVLGLLDSSSSVEMRAGQKLGQASAVVELKDGAEWRFEADRKQHSSPFGYASWITGIRMIVPPRSTGN